MKRLRLYLIVFILFTLSKTYGEWTYVASTGTSFILYGMSFPPGQSTIGYACGMQYTYDADGVIVKTTDGGNNWTQIWPASGTIDGLQAIWFTSDLVGYACGWNNYFIKTTDGGVSWTPVNTGADVWYYRDVEFWDANNGVAVGVMNTAGAQAAFVTTNAGVTWTPSTSGLAVNDVMGISYASQNTLYAVSQSAIVYKSVDGGHNWTSFSTLSAMLLGVDFQNANFGVVGGEEKIFGTNNGGASWSTYVTGYENFYAAVALPDGTGYCGGTDENIYKTSDYGATWTMEYNGSGSSTLYRLRQAADGTVFACGSQGVILKMTPPLNADFTANPTTVCAGGQVNFYDNSAGAVTSWSWTFEGGTPGSSSLENPVVVYSTPGTYDVQLVVTAGSNSSTEIKANFITVYGALVAPATPTGPASVCGSYTYQYSTQPVPYAETYEWSLSPASAGTLTGSGTTAEFMAASNWEGAYTVKVRAENLCGAGPWSPDFTGMLNHNPTLFDLLGDGSYCEGEEGAELSLSGSESGVTYELFRDNISTGVTVQGTGSPLSFGTYSETGLYTASGYDGPCTENMVGQIYVHVEPLPGQPGLPQGPATPCYGDVSTYTTTGAADADSYAWTLVPEEAGLVNPAGTTCTITWAIGFTGNVILTVTGQNDCGTGLPSEELDIVTGEPPAPMITGPDEVCDHEMANYSTAQNPGSSYVWEVTGGEIISGSGTWQVEIFWGEPGAGTISVSETQETGCTTTTDPVQITIDDCTAISELITPRPEIYPNPCDDQLFISGIHDATVSIYNTTGKEVMTLQQLSGNAQVNISHLVSSIYLIKVTQDGKMSVCRLVKR